MAARYINRSDPRFQQNELSILENKLKGFDAGYSINMIGTPDSGGIFSAVVSDSKGNSIPINMQANFGQNRLGTIWRMGDKIANPDELGSEKSLLSTFPAINPKVWGNMYGNGSIDTSVDTSADKIASIFNTGFRRFTGRKSDDDTTLGEFVNQALTQTVYDDDRQAASSLIATDASSSGQVQAKLMSKVNVGYRAWRNNADDVPVPYPATFAEKTQLQKHIKSQLGTHNVLNTANPWDVRIDDSDPAIGTFERPVDWGDIIQKDPRGTDSFYAPVRFGSHGTIRREFQRDDYGNVGYQNVNGATVKTVTPGDGSYPITKNIFVQDAVPAEKSGKASTYSTEGIRTYPSRFVEREVWDTERKQFQTRMIREQIAPQDLNTLLGNPRNQVVRSNIRYANETGEDSDVIGTMRNMVFAPVIPTPGAGNVFGNSTGSVVTDYANYRTKYVNSFPQFSLSDINNGNVSFDMNPANILGSVTETPRSNKALGSVMVGGKSTDLSMPTTAMHENISGMTLEVPRYVSKGDAAKWSGVPGDDFREVEDADLQRIRETLPSGFNLQVNNISRPRMYSTLSTRSAGNPAGSGIKLGENTMTPQEVIYKQSGASFPVDIITAESKVPLNIFMDAYMGGRSSKDQQALFADYLYTYLQGSGESERRTRSKATRAVSDWWKGKGAGYKMSWEDITSELINPVVGKDMDPYHAGADMLSRVFLTEDSGADIDLNGAKNARNIRRFKAGMTDNRAPLLGVHADTVELMRQDLGRVMRSGNSNVTDDEINQKFQDIYQFRQSPGAADLFNGIQGYYKPDGTPVNSFMAQVLTKTKTEYESAGKDVSPDILNTIYQNNPEIAGQLGYNPDEIGQQATKNAAILDLARWKNIRSTINRDDVSDAPDETMGKNTYAVDSQSIGALSEAFSNYNQNEPGSFDQLMDAVSEIAGGEDKSVYFPGMGSWPTMRSMRSMGYEEGGIQIGGISKAFVGAGRKMLDQYPLIDNSIDARDAGIEAMGDLYKKVDELFSAHGDAGKDMLKQSIPFSASLRYSSISVLGNNQAWARRETREQILRGNGLGAKEITEFEKLLAASGDQGIPMATLRYPQKFGKDSVIGLNLMSDDYIINRWKQAAPEGAQLFIDQEMRSAHNTDVIHVSQQTMAEQQGDFDYDPGFFAFLVKHSDDAEKGSRLYQVIQGAHDLARQRDPRKVQEIEERIYGINKENPDKLNPLIEKVSAELKTAMDALNPPDPLKRNAGQGFGLSETNLNEFMKASLVSNVAKSSGMGTTYNMRRSSEFAMAASGYNANDIDALKEKLQAHYQPYLDVMNVGPQQEGTKLAKMVSSANIKIDDKGNPYLSLSSSGDTDNGTYHRAYLNQSGEGLRETFSYMAAQADAGLTTSDGKDIQVTDDETFATLLGFNPEMRDRMLKNIQENKNPKIGRVGIAMSTLADYVNEGKGMGDHIRRLKQVVTETPVFQMAMANALNKPGHDKDGSEVPGNYGEGVFHSQFLLGAMRGGYNFMEKSIANAVSLAIQANKGTPGAHVLGRVAQTMKGVIDSFGNINDVFPGVRRMLATVNALGGDTVQNPSASYTGTQSRYEKALSAVRDMNQNGTRVDLETTGINPNRDNGFIWQLGINGAGQLINPGMTSEEYRKNYEEKLAANHGRAAGWMEHLPTPEQYDNGYFKDAPTFVEAWKNGQGQQIMGKGAYSSYNVFDKDTINQEFDRAAAAATGADLDYINEQKKLFANTKYTDMLVHIPNVFGAEIDRYYSDPENVGKKRSYSQQNILDILAWKGNEQSLNDAFSPEQLEDARMVAGAANGTHTAGYDTRVLGVLQDAASRRVESNDAAQQARANILNPVRPNSYVGNTGDEGGGAGTPAAVTGGGAPIGEVRASWLDNDPDTAEGRKSLLLSFAAEKLGPGSVPSVESIGGEKVHKEAQNQLAAKDPNNKWAAEEEHGVTLSNGVRVTGHIDDYSPILRRIIDWKPDNSKPYSFQMKAYSMMMGGAQTFIARYDRGLRGKGDFAGAALGAVNRVLKGVGLEPARKLNDKQLEERAIKVWNLRQEAEQGGHTDKMADDLTNGNINVPTDEDKLLSYSEVNNRVDPFMPAWASTPRTTDTDMQYQASQDNSVPNTAFAGGSSAGMQGAFPIRMDDEAINGSVKRLQSLIQNINVSRPFASSITNDFMIKPDEFAQAITGKIGDASLDLTDQEMRKAILASRKVYRDSGSIRAHMPVPMFNAAFGRLTDEEHQTILSSPFYQAAGMSEPHNAINFALDTISETMGRSGADYLTRQAAKNSYEDFFTTPSITSLGTSLNAHLQKGGAAVDFFRNIANNMGSSPHAAAARKLALNANDMLRINNSQQDVAIDPLMQQFTGVMRDEDLMGALKNPTAFNIPGSLNSLQAKFDDAAMRKKAVPTHSPAWEALRTQENYFSAQMKFDESEQALKIGQQSGYSDVQLKQLQVTHNINTRSLQDATKAFNAADHKKFLADNSMLLEGFTDAQINPEFQKMMIEFQNSNIQDPGQRLLSVFNNASDEGKTAYRTLHNLYKDSKISGANGFLGGEVAGTHLGNFLDDSYKILKANQENPDIMKPDKKQTGDALFLDPAKVGKFAEELGKYSDKIVEISKNIGDARTRETRAAELHATALKAVSEQLERNAKVDSVASSIQEMKDSGAWDSTDQENVARKQKLTTEYTSATQAKVTADKAAKKYKEYSSLDDSNYQTNIDRTLNTEDEDAKKSSGSFFRHIFGGFGLMFMQNAMNIAETPLKLGYTDRLKSQQEIGGSVFSVLGGTREVNPDEALSRTRGLYLGGQGWEAVQSLLSAGTKNAPGVMSGVESSVAGLSLYGTVQWGFQGLEPQKWLAQMGDKSITDAKWETEMSDKAKSNANLRGAQVLGAGVALVGMNVTNAVNAYGAMANPNVTSRAIASQIYDSGNANRNIGWADVIDPGAAAIGFVGGAIPGAIVGGTIGAGPGAVVGAVVGGAATAFTSQKNAIAMMGSDQVQRQTQLSVNALRAYGGNAGIVSAFGESGFGVNEQNAYINLIAANMATQPQYSDISQQSLANTMATSFKYRYDLKTQIPELARSMDRGVDLLGLSKTLPMLAGAGGLDFDKVVGRKTVDTYKSTTLSQLQNADLYAIRSDGSRTGEKYATEQQFQDMLTKTSSSIYGPTLNLGGAGDNVKSVRYTPNANGFYDVWGTTGNGNIQNLGVTQNVGETNSKIGNDLAGGTEIVPVKFGEKLVKSLMATISKENFKDGSQAKTEEQLNQGLPLLAQLGLLNKFNMDSAAQNGDDWLKKSQKAIDLQGTLGYQALQTDTQLWQMKMQNGTASYANAPDINQYSKELNPDQLFEHNARAAAQTQIESQRSTFQSNAFQLNELYGFGDPNKFKQQVNGLGVVGLQALGNAMNFSSPTFGNLLNSYAYQFSTVNVPSEQLQTAGVTNSSIDARFMYTGGYTNMTGLNGENQRVATGLGFGQGGNDFGWGGFSQKQMVDNYNLFGGQKGIDANHILSAAMKGIDLKSIGMSIKMPNGSTMDSLNGYEAITWAQRQEDYTAQQFSTGQQLKSANLSYAFTTGQGLGAYGAGLPAGGQWGLETRQMQLGWRQQEFGFNMQQQQMALSSSQFMENMGVNRQQMNMQRSWAQQDIGYNQQVRDLNWGWKQQDFAEESRFMTGRQRRLAERQMGRDTEMHNIEGDQIQRQIDRQKESWKLEDERYSIQIKQFNESKQLQQEQLDANRKFFEESKRLQIELQKLQHAQYLAEHQLQMEGIAFSQKHAGIMNDLANKLQLAGVQTAQYTTEINNVGAVGIASVLAEVQNLTPALKALIQPIQDLVNHGSTATVNNPITGASSYTPLKTRDQATSNGHFVVNLQLDGKNIQRWVVDNIAREM